MKIVKVLAIPLLLVCLTLLPGTFSPVRAAARWTILIYLAADNDLEPYGIQDFLEMAAVGGDANLNIVVQFDRAAGYDTSYGDWTTCKRFSITPGLTPTAENALADLGEVNMGDPNTLRDFIDWGTNAYPAENYALVLWSHGNGWRKLWEALWKALPQAKTDSDRTLITQQLADMQNQAIKAVGVDDSHNDMLTMREVQTALQAARNRVQLLGFDACLMSMLEVGFEVKDTGPAVMVASEEGESLAGWPWGAVLKALKNHPTWTPPEFAAAIVEQYFVASTAPMTMAALDLTQMDVLAGRVSDLADALRSRWTNDQVAIQAAAQVVMNQVRAAVLAEKHGPDYPGAHGLAIYFPRSAAELSPDYSPATIDFPATSTWDEFLSLYTNVIALEKNWVTAARAQSQEFAYPMHVDLYDFCARLHQSAPPLWEALDCPQLLWHSGGDGQTSGWFGQSSVFSQGGDAAQSGAVADDQSAWLQTTVAGPGTLQFSWKVSSEAVYDGLEFALDGTRQGYISGEIDWQQQVCQVPSGLHTLEWRYRKDSSLSQGLDCGWLDGVSYTINLSAALDNGALSFTTGGQGDWLGQDRTYLMGGSAAQSPAMADGQSSWLRASVTGPGTLWFYWKASSQTGGDFLEFLLDDVRQAEISGEVDWQARMIPVPAGVHTITWQYRKNGAGSGGADCGWVDHVIFSNPVLLGEALDNADLIFASGGDSAWFSQSETWVSGSAAAQSGPLENQQSAWIQTTVCGPGNLSFFWKVSSEAGHDGLELSLDGILQERLTGGLDWRQRHLAIPPGLHLVRWTYAKDGALSKGTDAGWLDKVEYGHQDGSSAPVLFLLQD